MNDNNDIHNGPWHVLCHLNPRQIEVLLRKECEGQFLRDGGRPSPFRFYIPYLYMPVAEAPDASEYTSELRNDFRNFVFIQAPAARIDRLMAAEWNTKARLRLYHYRDHEGKNVTVPDAEIRSLMSTFRDQTLKFFIGQPVDEFEPGDKVILNIAPWSGHEGVIKDIRLRKGRLTMTISMNIFSQTKSINFTDLRTGDITFEDELKASLFTGSPIDRFEEEVIDLLSHRFGNATLSKETMQADAARLKRLSTFDRLYMESDDTDHARFLSLRLISAVLRQSKSRKDALQKEAERLLAGKDVPATADEAYLMTALFVATRRAAYRDAVKVYRHAYPDCPDILRRYHTITKKMKARK